MLRPCRLPPARLAVVRCPAPGHAYPHFLDRARLLDPEHPAARRPLRSLPAVAAPQFTVRALPDALLHEPADFVPLNPLLATAFVRARWRSTLSEPTIGPDAPRRCPKSTPARHLADARAAALAQRGTRTVSLLFHTSKKATSKSSVVRRRLRTKMTAAIRLVLGYNADAVDAPKRDTPASALRPATPYPPLQLVSHPGSEPLFPQGWTYFIVPDLAVYKMPFPNLVQAVRKALLSLMDQTKRLEASWSLSKPTSPHDKSRSRPRFRAQSSDKPGKPAKH